MKPIYVSLLVISLMAISCAGGKNSNPLSDSNTHSPTNLSTDISLITVGDAVVKVTIAKTPEQQAQGLSGREKLADDEGMLFDFRSNVNKTPSFWMKEMRFSLDMIWIKDNKVLSITKNVPAPDPQTPLSELPHYSPPSDIDYILEVNAGWSDARNVKFGDAVVF